MKHLTTIVLLIFTTFSVMAQVAEKPEDVCPILVGEKLPNATLLKPNNEKVELATFLKEKPSVIVVYRGGWCPYCNAQLSGLADIQDEIINLGYQVIAISPDDVKNLNETENKETFKYQLLSDPNARFIQDIGIGFKTGSGTIGYLAAIGRDVSKVIPVPTVMIVNKKGEVLFEYINPNYHTRLSSEMLLAVLKTIK